jgi:hypothetical protein
MEVLCHAGSVYRLTLGRLGQGEHRHCHAGRRATAGKQLQLGGAAANDVPLSSKPNASTLMLFCG